MSAEIFHPPAVDAPLGRLERALIDEFVRARGYDPRNLSGLSEHEREMLLRGASIEASTRLAEVESRSHFVHELHDGMTGFPNKPDLLILHR
jgi:hypothetical protein